ncbi:uncharacterized protein LOC120206939 [Hibiscus syriacus]|nr:uncharacterized protein LOC120206939 [Hibiscus syriacus]
MDENGKTALDSSNNVEDKKGLCGQSCLSLCQARKRGGFMAMKGCKPPQRPKREPKSSKGLYLCYLVEKDFLEFSGSICAAGEPWAWLTDMCQERYEVREKKSSKKRPRGLKAMGSMESDSD